MIAELRFTIPGEPVAQPRARAFKLPSGQIRMYDPKPARNWKAAAQAHMLQACADSGLVETPGGVAFEGPVRCAIIAVFTCPRSHWRKREPVPRRPHAQRPDAENVAKAVLDAATGVVWLDDSQVAELEIRKIIGAQGEAPRVEVVVTPANAIVELRAPETGELFAQRSA